MRASGAAEWGCGRGAFQRAALQTAPLQTRSPARPPAPTRDGPVLAAREPLRGLGLLPRQPPRVLADEAVPLAAAGGVADPRQRQQHAGAALLDHVLVGLGQLPGGGLRTGGVGLLRCPGRGPPSRRRRRRRAAAASLSAAARVKPRKTRSKPVKAVQARPAGAAHHQRHFDHRRRLAALAVEGQLLERHGQLLGGLCGSRFAVCGLRFAVRAGFAICGPRGGLAQWVACASLRKRAPAPAEQWQERRAGGAGGRGKGPSGRARAAVGRRRHKGEGKAKPNGRAGRGRALSLSASSSASTAALTPMVLRKPRPASSAS